MRFAVFRAKTMLKIDLSDFQKEATRGEVLPPIGRWSGLCFFCFGRGRAAVQAIAVLGPEVT